MTYCSNCGKKISDGATFCTNCGAPQFKSSVPPLQSNTEAASASIDPTLSGEMTESVINDALAGQELIDQSASTYPGGAPTQQKPKNKSVGIIAIAAMVLMIAVMVFLRPSGGWSARDAQNAVQAWLDFYCMDEDENYQKYFANSAEDQREDQREEKKSFLRQYAFGEDVLVSSELRERYAEFYSDLMRKSKYTVGEAIETEQGFDVPITIEPITSLSRGEFVLLDILPFGLSDEEINERSYSKELDLSIELSENPTYGDPEEIIIHLCRDENDQYVFDWDDFFTIIEKACFTADRHWSEDRAQKAVEAVLGGVYQNKYAEMAAWTYSTEEELKQIFAVHDADFWKTSIKESLQEMLEQEISEREVSGDYSPVSDSVVQKCAESWAKMIERAKLEVIGIEGDTEEYIAKVRVTPFDLETISEEALESVKNELDPDADVGAYLNRYYELFAEKIMEHINNERYGNSADCTVHVEYNSNKCYELNYDDLLGIVNVIVGDSDDESSKENEDVVNESELEDMLEGKNTGSGQ